MDEEGGSFRFLKGGHQEYNLKPSKKLAKQILATIIGIWALKNAPDKLKDAVIKVVAKLKEVDKTMPGAWLM